MADTLIIQRATEELEAKSFGVTGQFLEIHQILHENGKPQVSRVDTEKDDGTAIVYFPVVNQKFYLAIYLDTVPNVSVRWVGIEPYHSVYFRASSDKLTLEELSSLTKLKATGGRNKGEKKRTDSEILWKERKIDFEPNPEADEFTDKLSKLLTFLEQDKEGVEKLVDIADGYIQVYSSYHNGNTLIGGHHIGKDQIKRMSRLNLEIDFDISADGNFYK